MTAARPVHIVVPDGIDDPMRPSGGNTYDRRLCEQLVAAGWGVECHRVTGDWPWPSEAPRRCLAAVVAGVPDGGLVVVDGLLASTVPEVLVPEAGRVRLVVLLHMPLVAEAAALEGPVLAGAAAVVTTSDWTRRRVLGCYALEPERVHVARPGVDVALMSAGTADGGRLLCVGALLPAKGQDLLVEALAMLADLSWECLCVGPLSRDPAFVRRVIGLARETGLDDRFVLGGCRTSGALDASYASADLLVHPSRAETYGMVVTEALARAVPVVAADVGGVAEALGRTADGRLPGMLIRCGDAAALAAALREWLTDREARARLRAAACRRRGELAGWDETAARVGAVLEQVAA